MEGRELSGEELARIYQEQQPDSYEDMLRFIGVTHTWEEYMTYVMEGSEGIPHDDVFWQLMAKVARHVDESRTAPPPANRPFAVEPTDQAVLQSRLDGVTKESAVVTEHSIGGLPVVFNPTIRIKSILCVEGEVSVTGGLEVQCTAEAFAECQRDPVLMAEAERMVRIVVEGLRRKAEEGLPLE